MKKAKCELSRRITDHSSTKKEFKDETIPCLLFARKGAMSNLGVVCSVCCVRINSLLEKLRRPVSLIDENGNLLPNDLIADRIKENKARIVEELTPLLKEYYDAVPKASGKDWDIIDRECGMCSINSDRGTYGWKTTIEPEGEAKPMTPVKT